MLDVETPMVLHGNAVNFLPITITPMWCREVIIFKPQHPASVAGPNSWPAHNVVSEHTFVLMQSYTLNDGVLDILPLSCDHDRSCGRSSWFVLCRVVVSDAFILSALAYSRIAN